MADFLVPGAWSVEMELNLFNAMQGYKPVGINRHFEMLAIHEKLNTPLNKKLTAKDVWSHLSTIYNLVALNDSDILPFPNKVEEFHLPPTDYYHLLGIDYPRVSISVPLITSQEAMLKEQGNSKTSSLYSSKRLLVATKRNKPATSYSKCTASSSCLLKSTTSPPPTSPPPISPRHLPSAAPSSAKAGKLYDKSGTPVPHTAKSGRKVVSSKSASSLAGTSNFLQKQVQGKHRNISAHNSPVSDVQKKRRR